MDDFIDLSKVWHQARDKMPNSCYGCQRNMILIAHQSKLGISRPMVTCEVLVPEVEEYLKENPDDCWCYVGELLLKEHRKLFWSNVAYGE